MKQASGRRPRPITSAPSGRPARPLPPPVRRQSRGRRILHWLTSSKWVLILGVIVLATILTIMYYRLTSPEATGAPSPTAGSPQALQQVPSWGVSEPSGRPVA